MDGHRPFTSTPCLSCCGVYYVKSIWVSCVPSYWLHFHRRLYDYRKRTILEALNRRALNIARGWTGGIWNILLKINMLEITKTKPRRRENYTYFTGNTSMLLSKGESRKRYGRTDIMLTRSSSISELLMTARI